MSSTFDLWKAAVAVGGLLLLLIGGTAGFHFVEGWGWWNSFWPGNKSGSHDGPHDRLRLRGGLYHVLVLAVRGDDGAMRFAPPPSDPLNPGDLPIVAGHRKDLTRLEEALGAAA